MHGQLAAVAVEMPDRRRQRRLGDASVEYRYVAARGDQLLHHLGTEEAGASDDYDAHRPPRCVLTISRARAERRHPRLRSRARADARTVRDRGAAASFHRG